MKKLTVIISAFLIVALLVIGAGCGIGDTGNGKLKIVTTLFPQYDFVREIVKEKGDVTLLLPPGVESHSFEPSPQDIVSIRKANLFIYTGEYMEPWAHKVIENTKGKTLVVVDTSLGIDLMDEEEDHDVEAVAQEPEEEDHHHGGKDPHIWVDPVYAQKMVDNIVAGLIKADVKNKEFYQKNGEAYKKKLQQLDLKFSETFKKTKSRKIMYGGHFAFGYFAKRYGLEHISPYNGFSPDAEPTAQRIAELIKNMKESGLKVIYYEELIDPKVAKIISDQTGAKMLLLHGAHNVTKEEMKANVTYLKIMEENLAKLKQGLGYDE